MTKDAIQRTVEVFLSKEPCNTVRPEAALRPDLAGLVLYEAPLVRVGSASDPLFQALRAPEAVGPQFLAPRDWLPSAQSVISVFAPYTEEVRRANRANGGPADEWLHGRYEGQKALNELGLHLAGRLEQAGYASVVPALDARFCAQTTYAEQGEAGRYVSNWSERHVAYICGMGTFGLSKGLITPKGMAGRLVSVVTALELPADTRPYEELYAYCTRCGACARRCPVEAISLEAGKSHPPCARFLDETLARHSPRYGCGKCQTGVPCEHRNPAAD